MTGEHDDDTYELEVTLTFPVPVTSSLDFDPHQMATHMRDTWLNDDDGLRQVLAQAVDDDFELTVKPVFML